MIRLLFVIAMLWPMAGGAQQNWSRLNQWTAACEPSGPCQLLNQGREGRVLLYRVGDATVLEYLVPLGIDIRKGVTLLIDGRTSFPTSLLTCKADGCKGFTLMNNRILDALAAGGDLEVVYTDVDRDRRRSLNFSLIGFTRAYNAFAR